MPPRPNAASAPTALSAASKGQAKSSADIAVEASKRVTAQRENGKPNKVQVVALKDGYDGLVIVSEGSRIRWPLAEGERLPSWLMLADEYDAQHASDDNED